MLMYTESADESTTYLVWKGEIIILQDRIEELEEETHTVLMLLPSLIQSNVFHPLGRKK